MPHTQRVFDWMDGNASIFKKDEPVSILYVGFREDSSKWWFEKFTPSLNINRLGLIDIWRNTCDWAQSFFDSVNLKVSITWADVRKLDEHFKPGDWDIIFWDHGPEHVTEDELKETCEKLKKLAGTCVLLCGPWGRWPQGPLYGNPHEEHKVDLTPEMFYQLGFTVESFGGEHQTREGELVAYLFTGVKEKTKLLSRKSKKKEEKIESPSD